MNSNELLYNEYLESNKAVNFETYNTTYKMYKSRMIDFMDYLLKYEDGILFTSSNMIENCVVILERYISNCRDRGNNNQTINNKITAISSFYIWCVRRNKISYHPFQNKLERLKCKQFDKRRESYFLTKEETIKAKVIMEHKAYKDLDKIIWGLMLDCGARISAIQNIKVGQIDFINGIIRDVNEKGGKIVDLMFFDDVSNILKNYIESNNLKSFDFIFKSNIKKNKPICQSTIRNTIRKIGNLIGYDSLYPHTIRKTAINSLYSIGGIELASEYANHTDVKVTKDHYIKKRTTEENRYTIKSLKNIY